MPFSKFAKCIESIARQSLMPESLIISDDSRLINFTHEMENLLSSLGMNYQYITNSNSKGMGNNSNFALETVTTKYVHILHCDDALNDDRAYEKMKYALRNSNKNWLFCSGIVNGGLRSASLSQVQIMGINTLGGPSGMFSELKNYLPYNPKFRMFVDVDQYLRLESSLGKPEILDSPIIDYGYGDWQVQKNVSKIEFYRELRSLIQAHPLAWKQITEIDSSEWNSFLIYSYYKLSLITINRGSLVDIIRFTAKILNLKRSSR